MALATDFKDDVLADSEQRRRYRIIENDDGTISLEDVTEYSQTGSKFGALEVNQERQAINELYQNKINYSDIINTLSSTDANKPLSAAQGKSLSDRVGSLSSLTTSGKASIVNAINSLMSGKVNFTDIVNNLTTTVANKALDARQGKALNDKITSLSSALSGKIVHSAGNINFTSAGGQSYGYIELPAGCQMLNVYMQEVTGNVRLKVKGFNQNSGNNSYTIWLDFDITGAVFLHWIYAKIG